MKKTLIIVLFSILTLGMLSATGIEATLGVAPNPSRSVATDLFFSEYIEGGSNNKALEIFNGTGAPVDLSDYKVVLYSYGGSTPGNSLIMSGILDDGEVYLIGNSDAIAAILALSDVTSNVTWYNGDDAVTLEKISTASYVDIIGMVGQDPGSAWTAAGGYSTVNKTLVRKPTVTQGISVNPSGYAAGDVTAFETLATEWDVYAQDTITYLGSHTFTPGASVVEAPVINPNGGLFFSNTDVSITCATDGAQIYYTVDGSDPTESSTPYLNPFMISGSATVKARAYKAGYTESPVVSAVFLFPTNVSTIAELRSMPVGTGVYRLTGEAVLTFQQANRHQKYIQDATAAILIDDAPGIITTAYNLYDGITGVTGTLTLYAGLLQYVPVADPGPATSTDNVVVPAVRTLATITSDDQAKLLQIMNVTLDATQVNFGTGAQNINATDASGTIVMRTFPATDYSGTPIPTDPVNIICLGGQYNATMQFSPRFLADFESAFDYPEGVPVQVGNDIITVTGGNANNSDGEIPPVNNPTFVAMGAYSLELLGAGPWTITIQTTAPWGAYYVEGNWHSAPNIDGVITLVIAPTTKGPIVAVILGSEDPTLPVELSSFTAVVTSDMFVNLNWVAESETDHAGYNIYRNGSGDLAAAQRINNLIINEGNAAGTQISYSYSDYEAYSNMQYYYWLESVSLGGVSQYFGPLQITVGNLEEDPEAPEILLSTKLLNAFPNPFNPNTNLRYTMKEAGNVTIEIFNTKGQLVRSFAASHTSPGFYQMAWDGRDMNGNLVSSGVYMYRMHSGNYSASKRMILAK